MAIEPQHLKKAAHDIRTPLQMFINFFAQLKMKNVKLPPEVKIQADLALSSIEKIKDIANRLDQLAGS